MIQFKITFFEGGGTHIVTGDELQIGVDGGIPSYLSGGDYKRISLIEVSVSEPDSQFRIVGIELSEATTDVRCPEVTSTDSDDLGRYDGSTTSTTPRSVTLGFTAPANLGSESTWVFGREKPLLKLTVKVKRQQ